MIRFFRHIRQRLLTDNPPGQSRRAGKFSKYLIYAIGEILLVVIGILIALQVDTWRQGNTDRQLEKEYLQRLVLDLDQDLKIIESIEGFFDIKEVNLKKVKGFVDDPTIVLDDSVMTTLVRSKILGFDLPNVRLTGTIQELISSGHLRLIQNTDLRNEILNYYAGWEHNYTRIERRQTEYPSLVLQITDRDGFFKEQPLYNGKSLKEVLAELQIEALFYRLFMEEVNYKIFAEKIIQGNKYFAEKTRVSIQEELDGLE